MGQQTNKEALFNEVKGSLFEYLMARELAVLSQGELEFIEKLDKNYLNVLSQQDRMVRQFYPELLGFLQEVSKVSVKALLNFLQETPHSPELLGKFSHAHHSSTLIHEADLMLQTSHGPLPLSLKLNKKNAFVNTKSGGIKSFFSQYFSFIDPKFQALFNQFVDLEFGRMSLELHALNDLEYPGDFSLWVRAQKSELPGELEPQEREILKAFYARVAVEMHRILSLAQEKNPQAFSSSLPSLMGFSSPEIVQLVCFHDFKTKSKPVAQIHAFSDVSKFLSEAQLRPFHQTSSVEIEIGNWTLQIRVKPMNKFTTTAIKINCSVKLKQSGDA
jgi:hypothetical protein